jgi:peptide/nickel transport system permease protein
VFNDYGFPGCDRAARLLPWASVIDQPLWWTKARDDPADWASRNHAVSARYLGRRLVAVIPVLCGITFLTFTLMSLLPGNAARAQLGPDASDAQVHALAIKLHLTGSFLSRYFDWLSGLLTGSFGRSLASGQTVSSIVIQRLPVSAEVVVLAMGCALVGAVPVAALSARWPGGIIDRVAAIIAVTSVSVAPFILATALIALFAVDLGWLPAIGYAPIGQGLAAHVRSLALPVAAVALPLFGGYTRVLRGDLVDQVLGADHIVTARSLGMSPWQIILRHALRNSLLGLVTLVGLNLGTLIGGAVIVEQVFGLPGLGSELVQAISARDVPVIEAIVIVLALSVVLASLLSDLAYRVLDPRIRLDGATA